MSYSLISSLASLAGFGGHTGLVSGAKLLNF